MKASQFLDSYNLYWIEEQKRIFIPKKGKKYKRIFIKSLNNRFIYDLNNGDIKEWKTGKFTCFNSIYNVLEDWVYVPYENLPSEFKTHLLLLGYSNE